MEFVLDADTAWDKDTIHAEIKKLNDEEGPKDRHPYLSYMSGETRFDLSQLLQYLDDSKKPLVFRIRKLHRSQFYWLRDFQEKHGDNLGFLEALKMGVESVKGISLDVDALKDGQLSDRDLDVLEKRIGKSLMLEVGAAVIIANDDLKKKN